MKLIISLIIGALFASSEAGRYDVKPSINVEGRHKRSISTDILVNISGISEIEITSTYSADEGLKAICQATGENLYYKWVAKLGDLLSNEVAAGNVLSINQVTKKNDREFCCQVSNTTETVEKCKRLGPLLISSDPLKRTVDSSVEMFCEVFGTDDHFDVKWEKAEGLPINAIVDNGFLKIPKLVKADTGNYSCAASSHVKTAFHQKIPLKVVAPPEIVELRSTGLDGEYDNNVTIQCITQPDETITYTWKAHTEGHGDLRGNEKVEGDLLSIYNFKKDNQGTFCCIATNTLLTTEKCLTLEPPVLEMTHRVILGSSLNLECHEFTRRSNMKIDWVREDGHQFPPNVVKLPNGSLAMKNMTIEDAGRYKCTATKGVLSASVTTIIEAVMIPVISIAPEINGNITAKLGEEVNLTCNTDGHPQPSVLWQKFSPETELYRISEMITQKSAVYEIKSLSENDAGLYLCSAENSAGSSNKTVRVVIEQPVLEVHPTVSHTVIAGRSVTLECRESAGYSNMKFTWSREDNSSFASNVHQSDNGSLTITNITINQEGRYQCSASNGLASASITAYIAVDSPISNIVMTLEFPSASLATFTCQAIGGKASWNWFSESGNLLENEVVEANKVAINMTSPKVKKDHTYCCEGFNTAGKLTQCRQLPHIILYPKFIRRHIGDSIQLGCTLIGIEASNFHIKWERIDGSPLSESAIAFDDRLEISTLAETDSGPYTCIGNYTFDGELWFFSKRIDLRVTHSASNGVASTSTTTEVEVRTLPVIKIPEITDGNITKKLGDKVGLMCVAEGHTEPNVQWRKFSNESNLYQAVSRTTPKFAVHEITSLSANDAGLYLCLAVNPAGSSNKTVRVVIEQPVLEVYPKDPHVVIAGSSITLECRESVGYSDMEFAWSREDNSSFDANVHQSDNGSLTIEDIAINQGGRYKCFATNGRASASVTADIAVEISLSIIPLVGNHPTNV